MPLESENAGCILDRPRSTSTSAKKAPPTTTVNEHLRPSRTVIVPITSTASPPDNPSSPTSSSSSLFSSVPSLSSGSTAYQPVPDWIASEISRNVLAAPKDLHGFAAVVGTADHSGKGGACCSGSGSGGDTEAGLKRGGRGSTDNPRAGSLPATLPVLHLSCPSTASNLKANSPPLSSQPPLVSDPLARPPFQRQTAQIQDRRPASRSSIIRPSDLDHSNDSDPDSDAPLTPIAMIGRLRDEYEHEVVKKQFLTKGSVTKGGVVNVEPTSPPDSPSAASSAPSQSPLFPLQNADLVELLNQDDRPTFLIDASNTNSGSGRLVPLQVVFANTALKAIPSVLEKISSTGCVSKTTISGHEDDFARFKTWVLNVDVSDKNVSKPTAEPVPKQDFSTFAGWRWVASTLRRRFRVIRGINTDNSATPECKSKTNTTVPLGNDSLAATASDDAVPNQESVYLSGTDFDVPTSKEDAALITASFDWTRIALSDDMPAHIQFARSVNWAATPLGPIESWSGDLRTMANLVMGSPHPAAMYWGPQYTAIYNDAYTSLAGQKHPQLMGSRYADGWAEIWDAMEPIFESAWNAGQAVLKQDNRLFIQRHGFLEETFFNWSLVPLVGSDGSVVALYNPAFENTRRKINERRMLTLNEVGERTAAARTIQDFWLAARKGLEYNEYDVPFALIYSIVGNDTGNDDDESDVSSILSNNLTSSPQAVLEGSFGVPQGHPAAALALDLRTGDEGFAPYMRQAILASTNGLSSSSPSPVVLSADNGTLPTELLAGLHGERGFGDPCRTVVVFPVQHPSVSSMGTNTSTSVSISGFVVMGTNPRRPYDRDYRLFVHLLARQLTTSLASAVLYEEEVRRSQRAARRAAQDRQELSQQLRIRTQQAVDSQNRFMRMAEFTPVGMFVTDGTGRITYCNDMWWEISRHPRQDAIDSTNPTHVLTPMPVPAPPNGQGSSLWATWMDSVEEEDQPGLSVVWNRLVHDKVVVTHEFRFKQKTTIETDGDEPIETTTWVLLRAYPEKDENGDLKGIFGCITDISQQKLAEEFQIQLRKEAVEHKRQQENFIDITSHEMRNPLSAILQTVDEITNTIGELRAKVASGKLADYDGAFDNILEASSTITLCTNHQKRIVDDVLTLSKLDSRLLPVTPVDVQPVMVIRGTLKMFEAELIAHDIHCTFRVQPSYQDLVGFGNWVKLDPSRLNQVLINLLSNAIKFTQSCEERSIVISLGASDGYSDPTKNDVASSIAELSYMPSRQDKPELADGSDWGEGQLVNLHIAVSDTGQGLQEEEKNVLFQHFSQSSPRTHVQYGGSGLGLYISRNLTELQGGQIGVASKKDHGSTFAFYIKSRKAASTPTGVQPGSSNLSSIITEPLSPMHSSAVIAFTSGGLRDGPGTCNCRTKTVTTATPIPQLPSPPLLIESPLSPIALDETVLRRSLSRDAITTSPIVNAASTAENGTSWSNSVWGDVPPLDVLIVEDNIVNQRVLQRQLNKSGNRTMVANHGGEALDILRQSSFWRPTTNIVRVTGNEASSGVDFPFEIASSNGPGPSTGQTSSLTDTPPLGTNVSVVLMDLEMPVMDGMTCARAIRALERTGTLLRHVPIIAVTAYARPEQIESAKAAGIDDVISKPFRLAQLMPKILELVAKYPKI